MGSRRARGRGGAAAAAAPVHSYRYIKTTLANLGTASDIIQHSIPAPSGAGFVASPAVAAMVRIAQSFSAHSDRPSCMTDISILHAVSRVN
eukprot:COSAG03_NODE_14796_length_451_cov_3.321023_1_plen_90_part_10